LINHFLINEKWFLVDLPGYGYAKTAKSLRASWAKFISDYIQKRENLTNLFVLIDSRHTPQKNDLDFINWCGKNNIPFCLVFTKIDKLSSSELSKNLSQYRKRLKETWDEIPPVFLSSSTSKHGKEAILNYIDSIMTS
ncbi:MAG: ribosome biogenesis GTP-binding protein YihA/YsxC, partial [Crocinitomicaceae bacterium]|nr:ribosome biogenesis GTP-binding protein YihA/YsxC [Crocinitomicaceae bacterium]